MTVRGGPLAVVVAVLAMAGCGDSEEPDRAPAPERSTAPTETADTPQRANGAPRVTTVASGLEAPWEIAFLPDGRALVSERPGRVRLLSREGKLR